MAKDDPQTIVKFYEKDTGLEMGPRPDWTTQEQRAFMDWCEARVGEWKARTDALGYVWPCWCIGTVGATQTYHEWLRGRVGL